MQFEEFFGCSFPVANVRLIPNLPIPQTHLGTSVPFDTVASPLVHEFAPFLIVFWWVGPACKDCVVRRLWTPMVLIRLWPDGKRLGHKTDLHIRPYATLEITIQNAVQNAPLVNRIALPILLVIARLAPINRWSAVA